MNKLYYIDLFGNTDCVIDGRRVKLLLQIFIAHNNKAAHFCVFGKGFDERTKTYEKYHISIVDSEKNLLPIPRSYIKKIIKSLNSIKDNDLLSGVFNNLFEEIRLNGKGMQKINLSSKVECYVTSEDNLITISSLYAYIGDVRLAIDALCFYCENGLDYRIYIEIDGGNIGELYRCHLLSGLKLFVNENLEGTYIPLYFYMDGGTFKFHGITEGAYYMRKTTLNMLSYSSENSSPFDIIDFVISYTGSPDRVKEEHPSYKWFMVIIPIKSLSIECEFGLGAVSFVRQENQEIQRIIKDTKEEFAKYESFALIHVNEYTMYKAYIKARNQIELSVNLLLNLLRDDSPCYAHGIVHDIIEKTLESYDVQIVLSSWFYLECVFPYQQLFGDAQYIQGNSRFILNRNNINNLKYVEDIELQLLIAHEDPASTQASLFNALKWVKKAWESVDDDDKVINSIVALEFVVAGEKGISLLTKSKRRMIKKDLLEAIVKHGGEEIDSETAENLSNKFDNNCTDTPFMRKLNELIQRLKIPVSKSDMHLISQARKKRNDIVHGRNGVVITKQELRLLCEIISTVAMFKLNAETLKKKESSNELN